MYILIQNWREGTTLVMLIKLLLWVGSLSLNQDIHWREGTTLVMLIKLLLWVGSLSLNQDIHWREGTTLVMLIKLLLWHEYAYSLWIKIYESKHTHRSSLANITNVVPSLQCIDSKRVSILIEAVLPILPMSSLPPLIRISPICFYVHTCTFWILTWSPVWWSDCL